MITTIFVPSCIEVGFEGPMAASMKIATFCVADCTAL